LKGPRKSEAPGPRYGYGNIAANLRQNPHHLTLHLFAPGPCVIDRDPEQLRLELAQLVKEQIDTTETRTLTDAEHFSKFTELGSVRKVWFWSRSGGLSFPLRAPMKSEIRWVAPTYPALHHVLTNPVYAGACASGKSRHQRYVDERGMLRGRTRHVPMAEWHVLLPKHHPGSLMGPTFQANQARIDTNIHPQPHQAGAAVREGAALRQGRATPRKCGRRLHTHYRGTNSSPGYHCSGKIIVQGRGVYCLNVGGVQID
jgi:hypothetical protein